MSGGAASAGPHAALREAFAARTRVEIERLGAGKPRPTGDWDSARVDARRTLHRMGGTAGSLGLHDLCWTGGAIEDAVAECVDGAALAEVLREGAAALADALARDLAAFERWDADARPGERDGTEPAA